MPTAVLLGAPGAGCRTIAQWLKVNAGFEMVDLEMIHLSAEDFRDLKKDITRRFAKNVVIVGLNNWTQVELLRRRPFVITISVDAPISERFRRTGTEQSLEEFVHEDDKILYGTLARCMNHADIHICNNGDLDELFKTVRKLELGNPEIFRPSFDAHFIACAFQVSSRSNCLRRAVGAVIVRDRALMSTGYNGTPSKTLDCLNGGCPRCSNPDTARATNLGSCLCVHAEVNAIVQAGVSRCEGGTLYVTCCPCLSCAKLIIQARIKRIIYMDDYDDDPLTGHLISQTEIEIIKFHYKLRKNHGPF